MLLLRLQLNDVCCVQPVDLTICSDGLAQGHREDGVAHLLDLLLLLSQLLRARLLALHLLALLRHLLVLACVLEGFHEGVILETILATLCQPFKLMDFLVCSSSIVVLTWFSFHDILVLYCNNIDCVKDVKYC